ncbi:ABC transporter permease [Effusibacillus dendaii]|uniref:ABC-2 type transporter transmembrane domain-containing protein n=1 Tax=Effusibacillus dendaii TaxID=2743772 RepID=A0A7I8DCY7_9BACL|nr:ABC transporter permease [Effusibacillus dendaii]BCJ87965.1 hypothetical protein skT53_29500 [Effusibacillus dendaii]
MAVLYLPHGLEQNRYQGKPSNIGFLVDYTIPSATSNLRSALVEGLAAENSSAPALGKLKAMGMSNEQIGGMVSSLTLQQRLLFNPTNDYINLLDIGYISILSLGILYGGTITIVPRLREEGKLAEEIMRPAGLFLRVLPYTFVYLISMILSLAALKQVEGLRFVGNPLAFMIPLALFCLISSLLGLVVGWNAPNQFKASGRAQLLVSPAFLLSGVISPIALFPESVQKISDIIPVTWYFKFFRGMGLRGGSLRYFWVDLSVLCGCW